MQLTILLWVSAISSVTSFVVLPYIQIDYAHLFKVAQCKSKCQEKYGKATSRELNDGTVEEYFSLDDEDYGKCETGCMLFQHRRDIKKTNLTGATSQGAKFWIESSAHSGRVGSSPISAVELLCQSPSMTPELDDSFEGLIGITKSRSSGPITFIIQWKQRNYALGYYDESQWITATTETNSIIRVDGLIPGVQYKFMISVIGPAGKLGETIQSEWAEVSNALAVKTPGAPLIVKNGYNTEHGVMAHLHFPRTAYDSCNFRVHVKNATSAFTKDIQVDPTLSILLEHLEFDSSYTVSLAALSSDKEQTTPSISVRFNSFQCRQVYGKGSLHCSPDPVSNIRVSVRTTNSTALVTWTPSAEVDNILTYAITYQAYAGRCNQNPTTVYLDANSRSYELLLPAHEQCEFMFRITNYDAIGREAFAETRIAMIERIKVTASLKYPVVVIISSFILLVIAILSVAVCKCCSKGPIKVSENKSKLTDYT